jgi:DNA mismatch repair ATPase MutS
VKFYDWLGFYVFCIFDEFLLVCIAIRGGHHPLLSLQGASSVPNDALMGQDSDSRLYFLTGGQDRGKTTYIRMIALITIMGQSGLPVPADSAEITPLSIISSIRKIDSTTAGLSSFRAEARRIAEVLRQFRRNPRSLLILDEAFTGTDNESRDLAERSLLSYLSQQGALALVASHSRDLSALEGQLPGFHNFHGSDDLATKYQILPGPSRQKNALDVLEEEGLPAELIREARRLLQQP